MRRKFMLMTAGLVLGAGLANAQVSRVTGNVTSDEDGFPLAGAAVKVKGTNIGTITDANGNYVLKNVPADAKTLVITFLGMKPMEVHINERVDVIMKTNPELLDEAIVVAYGTAKKSSFTGSAVNVKGEDIQKLQVSNVSKALEGQIAGVQIASSSGTPGASAEIRIRGIGSISSSQEPLIVVDGVPYEGSLNSIAPQDIANMTVLKDAAANSMYGARGSNGVIIITTKGSKEGKPRINFDARWGTNTRGVDNYDIFNVNEAGQYYGLMHEALRNRFVNVNHLDPETAGMAASANLIPQLKYNIFKGVADNEVILPDGTLNPLAKDYKWHDNWQEDPFENGTRQEYNFNITGGTDKTQAYASLGYLKDEGYMVGSDFERINARVKIDQKIGDYIKVGANVAYANTNMKKFGSESNNFSNIFMFSQSISPISPIYLYDQEGQLIYDAEGNVRYDFGSPYAAPQNPLAVAKENLNETKRDNLSTRGYFEANFLKDFKFTANIAYDVFNSNETDFMTPIGGDAANVGGRGTKQSSRYAALNMNQLLNWNHDFNGHKVGVLLGHETKQDESQSIAGQMTNFADPNNPEFSNAAKYETLTSGSSEYALEGYFVKADYNFLDRYYVTASYRRDGSSRFHKDNRWGNFWAVGGSWRMKEESWLKNVNWLDNLKLKASFGTQGNDNVGFVKAYEDLYSVGRVNGEPALNKVFRGNKDLTWEKSNNFNLGVEAGFLNRIRFNMDFFIKETKDMLYASPLAPSEGTPSFIWRNEMDMKNTGVEFELSADIIKNNNWLWNVSMNATHYKNELTKLPESKRTAEVEEAGGYQAGSYWRKKGGSLYDFYLYEYAGVNKETGEPQYNKYVTNPETGEEEVVLVNKASEASLRQTGKSAIPALTGGLNTSVEAYGFDLSVQTAFQIGGYVMDNFYAMLMNGGKTGQNFHKDMLKRWTPENTNSNIPAVGYEMQDQRIDAGSDFFLTKASYFNLKNITFGYTLPTTFSKRIGIDKCRLYFSGDNVWLASKRKGLDPRQGFGGGTGYNYSAMSTYSFGLSLTL